MPANQEKANSKELNEKDYIPLIDFIYTSYGAFLKPNKADLELFIKSFNNFLKTYAKLLLRKKAKLDSVPQAEQVIKAATDIMSKWLKNCLVFTDERNITISPGVKVHVTSKEESLKKVKSINGKIIPEPVEIFLNLLVNGTGFNHAERIFDFHDFKNDADKPSTFSLHHNAYVDLSEKGKEELDVALSVLNKGLRTARLIWANRITEEIKTKKILAVAKNANNQTLLIEHDTWFTDYKISYRAKIFKQKDSDAPPFYDLRIHKDGRAESWAKITFEEVCDYVKNEYEKSPQKNTQGSKKEFFKYIENRIHADGFYFTYSHLQRAWDYVIPKKEKGWRQKPKAR